jgi:hypothetical protein
LAVPRLRYSEGLAGSSFKTEEPTWRGRDGQLDYALPPLSQQASQPYLKSSDDRAGACPEWVMVTARDQALKTVCGKPPADMELEFSGKSMIG